MHTKPKVYIALILLLLISFFACHTQSTSTKVTQVIDGDTVILDGRYHARYICIDAPEKGEPYFWEATQMNKTLVEGKKIRLEKDISERDKYGRLLYYVYVGDTFVNAEMVRLGYAHAVPYSPDVKHQLYLEAMETEAKRLRRGIWK